MKIKRTIIFLWIYTAILFAITETLSIYHNRGENIFKEKCILVIIGFLLIEIVNQFSYRLSKLDYHKASIFKCVCFWLTFSILIFVYWVLLFKTDRAFVWNWPEFVGHIFVYLIGIHSLPFYSLNHYCPVKN